MTNVKYLANFSRRLRLTGVEATQQRNYHPDVKSYIANITLRKLKIQSFNVQRIIRASLFL